MHSHKPAGRILLNLATARSRSKQTAQTKITFSGARQETATSPSASGVNTNSVGVNGPLGGGWSTTCRSVQSPDRYVEHACKSNPCRKWYETPSCQPV